MDRDNKTLYIRPFFYFFFPFFLFCVCLQLMSSAPFVYTNRISRGFSAIHMAWIFPPRIGRGIPAGRRKKKLFLNNNNTQNKGERTSRLRREALWCFSFFKKGIPLDNVLTSRKPLYSLYFLRWVREKKKWNWGYNSIGHAEIVLLRDRGLSKQKKSGIKYPWTMGKRLVFHFYAICRYPFDFSIRFFFLSGDFFLTKRYRVQHSPKLCWFNMDTGI